MNVLEYIEAGGMVKTSSGYNVSIILSDDEKYPIHGTILKCGITEYNIHCKWDKNGLPHNLPETHGFELNPVVKEVIYHVVHRSELKMYNDICEFETKELKKKRTL